MAIGIVKLSISNTDNATVEVSADNILPVAQAVQQFVDNYIHEKEAEGNPGRPIYKRFNTLSPDALATLRETLEQQWKDSEGDSAQKKFDNFKCRARTAIDEVARTLEINQGSLARLTAQATIPGVIDELAAGRYPTDTLMTSADVDNILRPLRSSESSTVAQSVPPSPTLGYSVRGQVAHNRLRPTLTDIAKWLRGSNTSTTTLVYIPINVSNSHWVTGCFKFEPTPSSTTATTVASPPPTFDQNLTEATFIDSISDIFSRKTPPRWFSEAAIRAQRDIARSQSGGRTSAPVAKPQAPSSVSAPQDVTLPELKIKIIERGIQRNRHSCGDYTCLEIFTQVNQLRDDNHLEAISHHLDPTDAGLLRSGIVRMLFSKSEEKHVATAAEPFFSIDDITLVPSVGHPAYKRGHKVFEPAFLVMRNINCLPRIISISGQTFDIDHTPSPNTLSFRAYLLEMAGSPSQNAQSKATAISQLLDTNHLASTTTLQVLRAKLAEHRSLFWRFTTPRSLTLFDASEIKTSTTPSATAALVFSRSPQTTTQHHDAAASPPPNT